MSEYTTWLIELGGDRRAHLYPEDDDVERAACGFMIEGECGECGHTLDVRPPREKEKKCSQCLAVEMKREEKA